MDVGVRVRRSTNYLDNAKREPGGKLVPQIENVTLKDRQAEFALSMRAQKNKVRYELYICFVSVSAIFIVYALSM